MEAQPTKRGRGRPRKHPAPDLTPRQPVTITVTDERPFLPTPKLVATFERVPADWTIEHTLKFFGIAEHLTVRRVAGGDVELIQPGRRA